MNVSEKEIKAVVITLDNKEDVAALYHIMNCSENLPLSAYIKHITNNSRISRVKNELNSKLEFLCSTVEF